jgi:class 3 adenylate cyclase
MAAKDIDLLSLSGADAERAWRLAHGLDRRLEECQRDGDSAARTLERVAPWILEATGADGLAVRLLRDDGEGGGETLFFGPTGAGLGEYLAGDGADESDDGLRGRVVIEVDDEPIGSMAVSFPARPPSPGAATLLEVAKEELDNLLYEIRRARSRHAQVIEIERRLKEHVLELAIDQTALYLLAENGARGLVAAYSEETSDAPRRRCRAYLDGSFALAAASGDGTALGSLLDGAGPPDTGAALAAAGLPVEHTAMAVIETGLAAEGEHGFIATTGPEASATGARAELLQHFAVALGQRLVDYHKDQRYLQQFFAPDVVSRLLQVRDYQGAFLTPRLRDVAMLFTDITSFTRISEQVLAGPEEVGALIDYWSAGVVDIVFSHGGVFDKMVGDCVIGIFGTPFDDFPEAERVAHAIQAAFEIREYTGRLAGIPALDAIRASDLVPGLGVATGVSFGRTMVGTFGPNHAFTAFGREMNNTARLQGVAGYQEILVMQSARDVLAAAGHPLERELSWGPLREQAVKNVKEPLRFFGFSHGR